MLVLTGGRFRGADLRSSQARVAGIDTAKERLVHRIARGPGHIPDVKSRSRVWIVLVPGNMRSAVASHGCTARPVNMSLGAASIARSRLCRLVPGEADDHAYGARDCQLCRAMGGQPCTRRRRCRDCRAVRGRNWSGCSPLMNPKRPAVGVTTSFSRTSRCASRTSAETKSGSRLVKPNGWAIWEVEAADCTAGGRVRGADLHR
jgi:hypothetical protein